MGCGCSTDVTPSQLSQTNSVGEPNDVKVKESSPRNCEHEALLLAEEEDLLKRLPPNEVATILATLLDSSTPVAVLMKEDVARQTAA